MNKPMWSKVLMSLVILVGLLCLPLTVAGAADGAASATPPEAQTFLSLSLGEFIGIVFSIAAFIFTFGKILWDWARDKKGSLDERLLTHATTTQANRDEMERLEKAYALGGLQAKTAVDGLVAALQIIAPLTATKADNAYLQLLQDIQKAGPPETPSAVETVPQPAAG